MTPSSAQAIKKLLDSDDPLTLRTLFAFTVDEPIERIILKFNLWARKCFPKYFASPDAPFHARINELNCRIYLGDLKYFVNVAFRGAAKTAKTKLFIAFCLANDLGHFRKYIKVIAEDGTNSQQIVTDIYNMMVSPIVAAIYPDVFEKTTAKREETMGSFTTATGIKVVSGIVGSDQRGALQEESRPDLIWFEDFENRKTLRSAVKTIAIWENMEEARTSLSQDGSALYTCNYISEQGNVHKLVTREAKNKEVLVVPILDANGVPTWQRFTLDEIEVMRQTDDDFEGERMCQPSASKDIMFDRSILDDMKAKTPVSVVGGFKIYKNYDPSHRYASGHDIAGGVGLDSSTSVFIDFDTLPAQVVGVYANNLIKPEVFGHEIHREAQFFGNCLVSPERNYGTEAILILKQLNANIHIMARKDSDILEASAREYGWPTNALTKPKMLFALGKAIEDGLISLNDKDLIAECKAYTRNDLLETIKDPRLTTRHFDLLMACAIAWQMKDYAQAKQTSEWREKQTFDRFSIM